MNVQMENGLAAVAVCVYDDPIAVARKSVRAGDTRGGQQQVTERFFVSAFGFIERIEMLLRHDQQMRRRLRAEIVESQANFIFVNFCRKNIARDYLAKNAVLLAHFDYSLFESLCLSCDSRFTSLFNHENTRKDTNQIKKKREIVGFSKNFY